MKSFSVQTKEELCKELSNSYCCNLAEYTGLLLFGCGITENEIKLVTENKDVLTRFEMLGNKLGFPSEIYGLEDGTTRFAARIIDKEKIAIILNDFDLIDTDTGLIKRRISPAIIKLDCCKRAFVKGAFIAGGTIIDPSKNYNLEIITPYLGLSKDFAQLLKELDFDFKTVVRKSRYVLYAKNSELIEDFLTYIGAYQAQMSLINVKIEKEIRNDFNRFANSETANLVKAIEAAVNQTRAIEKIDAEIGIDNMPDELRDIAKLRLANKSMSLAEIGKQLSPPLSKSGVNRRFQKIMAMAEKIGDRPEE